MRAALADAHVGFEHAATVFEVPADPDQPAFVLADLNPMEIHVAVEIGRRGSPGHLILADSGPLTLLPGKASHLTLRCDAAPEIPERVPWSDRSGSTRLPACDGWSVIPSSDGNAVAA